LQPRCKPTLNRFGFEVELADSGKGAHAWLTKAHFDLIVVDFDLSPRQKGAAVLEPSKSATGCWSGTGLIRELRAARIMSPILVHTVLEGELYETASLDAGADDYIVKKAPISILLSRLHAHLRRRERDLGLGAKGERRLAVGRFTLDRRARVLLADEKPITLKPFLVFLRLPAWRELRTVFTKLLYWQISREIVERQSQP
jgi:DNA-binding response OmpR family regulator